MEPGKPDAGKPPVRFDEGREADGHWPLGFSTRRFPPTLHIAYLKKRRERFISTISNNVSQFLSTEKFDKFIDSNGITDKFIRLLPKAGILIDEDFPPQLMKAVRFLNNDCGFSIRMLKAEAFVAEDWRREKTDHFMRLDFVDIQ